MSKLGDELDQLKPAKALGCFFFFFQQVCSNHNTTANPSLLSYPESIHTTDPRVNYENMLTEPKTPLQSVFTAAVRAQLNKLTCSWRHHHWPEQCTMTQCLCFMKQESFGSVYLHTFKSIWLTLTLSSPAIILSPEW